VPFEKPWGDMGGGSDSWSNLQWLLVGKGGRKEASSQFSFPSDNLTGERIVIFASAVSTCLSHDLFFSCVLSPSDG